MRSGVRLGVDPGEARIGVARCDPSGILATPVETISRGEGDLDRLVALVVDAEPLEVVLGLPVGLNGREGPAAQRVREFAIRVAQRVHPIGVRLVDERLTTVTATSALRASGRTSRSARAVVDQAAAVVILQHALDAERATGAAPGQLVGVPPEPPDYDPGAGIPDGRAPVGGHEEDVSAR